MHFVNRPQKCFHKAAFGLSNALSKPAAFGIFSKICMQNAFSPSTFRGLPESEGGTGLFLMVIYVAIVHLVNKAQKCSHKATLCLLNVLSKMQLLQFQAAFVFKMYMISSTSRRFAESEGDGGILFRIHICIVHLVNNAHKLCYKAAYSRLVYLSKTANFMPCLCICAQNTFFPTHS